MKGLKMDGDCCQALVLALYCFFFLFVSDLIPRFFMYVTDLLCSSSSAICFHVSHISYSISDSEVKIVNIPKARNTYCAKCNKHQKFKVI